MNANHVYRGVSHGKVILIGEHSAVYSQPAIVLPLHEAQLSATLTPRSDAHITIDCEYFQGNIDDAPENLRNTRELIHRLVRDFSLAGQGFQIRIVSDIPHARGMGSSAAVAVAVIRAVAQFTHRTLNFLQEFEYAQIAENIAHSNASGMDSATVASDGAVWFMRDEEISTFSCDTSGGIVVADSGVTGETRSAVSDVRALLQSQNASVARRAQDCIQQLGTLAYTCADALRSNELDTLGDAMNSAHNVLSELTVSSPELDALVGCARRAGALGAKLTGGGRGGCMIALAQDSKQAESIANNLRQSGAVHTWNIPLVFYSEVFHGGSGYEASSHSLSHSTSGVVVEGVEQ